ncbi:hypothetical protein EJ05DRAFT_274 [Pseudovirgaria hyperparasitica]|uniref:Uncharacterized protein n=1 Tax=Pseudovirgaria hyperparasitica TaxID=470096 RepID=A0A6A6WK52_9PEZI|nr:uncharacterized protein EJ05DRAFT_274 [Pseudovirgaria hyperparasitica]KAF2762401.1 hypothetical protein EJ05DRAFT_274 [Pseudovirgaria hyperparasitica]
MAPVTKPPKNNRDIKDFFKPRPVSQTSPANAIDRQSSERTWPSPIPPRRGRDQSASGSTRQDPSPTATPSITAAMNDHDIQSLNKP